MDKLTKLNKIKGALIGLAVGDALGVHLEFTSPKDVVKIYGYTEGNPYGIPIGYWTDDTSMALCMGQSLIEKKCFDANDIMTKFCNWQRKGYMSSTDECFDIGNTTRTSLMKYWRFPDMGPFCGDDDTLSAGNGSIMRLAPIPMFFHTNLEQAMFYAGESSRLTHANSECIDSCKFLSEIIWAHINMTDTEKIHYDSVLLNNKKLSPKVKNIILESDFLHKDAKVEGTGYVIDSLKASLWACNNSFSFEEAVLNAVNLGDDADTTGAVTGQIAGAYYGYDAIPQHWKDKLRHHDMIVEMAVKLAGDLK